jgi:pilus assembly protein CpaF
LQDIFRFEPTRRGGKRIAGQFAATGIVPRLAEELRDREFAVPLGIFQKVSK